MPTLSDRYRRLKKRQAQEPHLRHRAWHEDPEIARFVLDVFASFAHHWVREPGSTEAVALCTGFRHRGERSEQGLPRCPGCANKLAKCGHAAPSSEAPSDVERGQLALRWPAAIRHAPRRRR